jgi:enoyl-CoA hydratase/carnithine racemase
MNKLSRFSTILLKQTQSIRVMENKILSRSFSTNQPPTTPTSSSTTKTIETSNELKVTQTGSLLKIELNRPRALNALTLQMCLDMKKVYNEHIAPSSSGVNCFIVKGANDGGHSAFCAGGDIKSLYNALNEETATDSSKKIEAIPGKIYVDFFRHEYALDHMFGTSEKPQISFWNGVVMGGGVGISVLGEYRVATEKTAFAMPETAIGLFPDVGGSAWLPHLNEDGYGNYIGLCGPRLKAADVLHAGIATHYIET